MQHSLRHRFRGAILGAVLGEILGINCHQVLATQSTVSWRAIQQGKGLVAAAPELCWSQIAVQQSEVFIQEKFREKQEAWSLGLPLPPTANPVGLAELAIATLPVTLFYHEDWHQLQQRLEQMASTWQISLPITGVLAIAYTISLALRERLHLDTLIPRLITDLELHDRDAQLMRQLNQVQSWVQQRAGVTSAKSLIQEASLAPVDPVPIAVAFYSFLSTPADFQLSLLRAAQILPQPQGVCALVGALSGAYNGLAGIPLHWRQVFSSTAALSSSSPSVALVSESQLLQQADLLWAVWSGADQPDDWLQRSLHPTVASPHLIRPR